MPCTDGREWQDARDAERFRRRVNDLARYLCSTLRLIEAEHPEFIAKLPADVIAFWVQHQEEDRQRGT